MNKKVTLHIHKFYSNGEIRFAAAPQRAEWMEDGGWEYLGATHVYDSERSDTEIALAGLAKEEDELVLEYQQRRGKIKEARSKLMALSCEKQ